MTGAARRSSTRRGGAQLARAGISRLAHLGPNGPDGMGRELAEGPEGVVGTLIQVASLAPAVDALRASARRIVLLGTGSSWWAIQGALASWRRREETESRRREVLARPSAEVALSVDETGALAATDLVIAVSQSGSSPETLAAARRAAAVGSPIVAVTAHPESPLGRLASLVVETPVGEEQGAATKSHLAALAALVALAGGLPLGREDVRALGTWLQSLVDDWTGIVPLATALAAPRRLWFLGFRASEGAAGAAALLWHEKVRRPAIAASVSEFRHGLVEAARSGDAAIVLVARLTRPLAAYLAVLEEELEALGVMAVWMTVPATGGRSGWRPDLALPPGEPGAVSEGAALLGLSLRVQQLARGVAHAAGTYREEFRILRRIVRPASL